MKKALIDILEAICSLPILMMMGTLFMLIYISWSFSQ